MRIAPYSNSRVGLWRTFSRIVLRVIIVSFSKISLTREKRESIQSRKNKVCFLYEMFELYHKHCFSNAVLAGVSVDHFCLLSNQQDKTFLQNVFLINPRPLNYLTDKSDEKQHKFLPSLDIISVGICVHFSSFSIINLFAQDRKKDFYKSSTLIMLTSFFHFLTHNSSFYLFKGLGIRVFFLPNLKKQCFELFNNIRWRYKCLHSEDYLR